MPMTAQDVAVEISWAHAGGVRMGLNIIFDFPGIELIAG